MTTLGRLFRLALKTAIIYNLILAIGFASGKAYYNSLWAEDVEANTLKITFEPFINPNDIPHMISLMGLSGNIRSTLAFEEFASREVSIVVTTPFYSLRSGENWRDNLLNNSSIKAVEYQKLQSH